MAFTIAHSPLVKTALFASDPNWGRLLAAIGRAGLAELEVDRVGVYLNDVLIAENGCRAASYTEEQGVAAMAPEDIVIRIELQRGSGDCHGVDHRLFLRLRAHQCRIPHLNAAVHVAVGVILDGSQYPYDPARAGCPPGWPLGVSRAARWSRRIPGAGAGPRAARGTGYSHRPHQRLLEISHDYGDKSVLLDVHVVWEFSGEARGLERQPLAWVAPRDLPEYAFPAANAPIWLEAVLRSATAATERSAAPSRRLRPQQEFLVQLFDQLVQLLQGAGVVDHDIGQLQPVLACIWAAMMRFTWASSLASRCMVRCSCCVFRDIHHHHTVNQCFLAGFQQQG